MSRRSAAYAAGIGEANRPHSNKGESFREFCARAAAHSSKYALYRTFHRKGEAFREERRRYLTPIRHRSVPDSRLHGTANLLVMPGLDSANIAFNLLKAAAALVADILRGCPGCGSWPPAGSRWAWPGSRPLTLA